MSTTGNFSMIFEKKKSGCCPKGVQKFPIIFRKLPKNGSRVRHSGESLSHSTNLTRVQISASTPSVGKGCFWLSPCSDRFFSGYSGFLLNLKTNTFKFQLDLKRASTFNPLLPEILHWSDTKNSVPIPFHPDFPETFRKW